MYFRVGDHDYLVVIDKKRTTRNTYIRIKDDFTIYVTTNTFTSTRSIESLLKQKQDTICKMIEAQRIKNDNNHDFHFLGKRYEIVYTNEHKIIFGEKKVFLDKSVDLEKFYKKEAKKIFLEHLNQMYEKFSRQIPYPDLRIRKMSSRWGVCNTKLKTITLNSELMKRDTKYLDYVIIHELSHLIHANHSNSFWELVEENCPNYKQIRKEMKAF